MKKINIIIFTLIFFIFNIKGQYNLILKLDPNSSVDEAYITVKDKKDEAIINHKFLSKDKPISATVSKKGPFFITFLSHEDDTIDKHWSSGLGEINIPKTSSSMTYEVCIDDKRSARCPKYSTIIDPDWPNIALTGIPTISQEQMTIVE